VKALWQIRDVKHGKVFSFESFDEMVEWILKVNKV